MRRHLAAALVGSVLLAGCSSAAAPGQDAASGDAPAGASATAPTADDPDAPTGDGDPTEGTAGEGSDDDGPDFAPEARRRGDDRDFPLDPTAEAPVGEEWVVQVVGFDPDATAEVLDFNAGNRPPPEGEVFALARIRATYVGPDESANAFLNLEWALVDATGQHHTDADCGVLPDDLASQSGAPRGGSAEGTICFATPVAELDDVVLFIAPLLAGDEGRVWWTAPSDGSGRVLEG